jgi:hypothetical protein
VNSPTGPRAREPRPKLGLSVPVYESPETFAHLLLNLWVFIPESVVCVHLNPSAPLEPFQAVVEHHERLVGWKHAWIAKQRIGYRRSGNLVPLYMTCFQELVVAHPKLTHLMSLCSNQMFIRPGTYNYVKKFEAGVCFHPPELSPGRNWRDLDGTVRGAGVNTGPPTGAFFKRRHLEYLQRRSDDQTLLPGVQLGAFEEVFFQEVVKELKLPEARIGDPVCHTWLIHSWPISHVEAIVNDQEPVFGPLAPLTWRKHGHRSIFSVKRVPRVLGDPLRTFIDGLMHQHGKRYRTEAMRAY